jgi:hypothetical protein
MALAPLVVYFTSTDPAKGNIFVPCEKKKEMGDMTFSN